MVEATGLGITGTTFLDREGHRWTVGGPSVLPGYTDVYRDDGLRSCRVTLQLHRALGHVTSERRQTMAAKPKKPAAVTAPEPKRKLAAVPESGYTRDDRVTLDGRAGRITGFARDGKSIYVRFDEGRPTAGKFSIGDLVPAS